MKTNQFQNLPQYFIGMLLCFVFSSTIALGQEKMVLGPKGEGLIFSDDVSIAADVDGIGNAIVVPTGVAGFYKGESNVVETPEWHPKSGYIIAAKSVRMFGGIYLKVLLNDLTVVRLDFSLATEVIGPDEKDFGKISQEGGSQSFVELAGDATYVLSTMFLYVYRDSVSSWQVDTTGLGTATINYISLDTAQYVYAATTNGVFKQHPDSNVWHQITNLPKSNFSSILVDRRNRIFAANYVNYNGKGTYISTDNGSSWTLDSAGIGTHQILKLSDDAYGNTYAIANGYFQVYRRKNNTPGWTRIDGGITAITVNPVTFNSVGGDSVLLAATSFGLYASTDQGTTWTEDNAGIPAETFYSFVKGTGGKWFTSTSLAVYSLGSTDTAWTKVYPTSGYQGSMTIYTDGIGNIYTSHYNSGYLYKSSNNGSTWSPDTAGGGIVPQCIDENGGQHAGLMAKPYGGSWGWDTAGFHITNSPNNYIASIASDHHGYLYLSGKFYNGNTLVHESVMRRPINGGTWLADTAGLSNYGYLGVFCPGKNGDMYGIYHSTLFHRSNGVWSVLNLPSLTIRSINSLTLSVDSSGALFAYLYVYDANSVNRPGGVYFTTDTGSTWKYAGLDSIQVNQLVSYGDSTYAATNNGLYILTRTAVPVTRVQQVGNVPMTYALFQNYPNPFNPTTTISYQLKVKSFVTLTVYDILGRKIRTLVNEEQPGGSHSVNWDAASFSSGIYFYRIQAGNFAATKKLLLLK